jgi:hypothetical protein
LISPVLAEGETVLRAATRIVPPLVAGRRIPLTGLMRGVTKCAVLTIALAALATPVLAYTQLNCSTKKVVIISAPGGTRSSTRQEDLGFWVDDAAKTLRFAGAGPLDVTQFGKSWISANSDGIFYEFDRQDGTLTYASSTTKDGVTTTIVGWGRCQVAPF